MPIRGWYPASSAVKESSLAAGTGPLNSILYALCAAAAVSSAAVPIASVIGSGVVVTPAAAGSGITD